MRILGSANIKFEKSKVIFGLPIPLRLQMILFLFGGLMALFMILPIIALFTSFRSEDFVAALSSPHLVKSLLLSLGTTSISALLVFVFGTPLAYILARLPVKGKELATILIELPIVIPPSVAGLGLLLVFGRRGFIGEHLSEMGISISFTTVAVIFAQVFIAAPFFIRAAREGFSTASPELEAMGRSLGATWWRSFIRVTLPLAKPFLISGIITSWARALGEFGATIMFAGNFLGKTETMPLAIYSAMNEDIGVAIVLGNILLVISILLMTIVRVITRNKDERL